MVIVSCILIVKKLWRITLKEQKKISENNLEKTIDTLNNFLEIQRDCIGQSEYVLGFYNGMELTLATLEKREPKYEEIKKDIKRK